MAATARSRAVPSWLAGVHDLPIDIVGALTVIGLTAYAAWRLLVGGTMLGMDSATFFYPVYSLLGEQLRAGELPVWNPHQLAGTPLAADPQSGWTYLPAMLIFSLLPLTAAVTAFVLFHFVAAGLATYALARVLGCDILGALTAAVAYEFSGFFFDRAMFGPAYYEVALWLPLLILGAELAIRSDGWLSRGCWWSLAGLALSQILAAWLGQGAYYALLVLGGYVAYRTLVTPPPGHDLRWRPA